LSFVRQRFRRTVYIGELDGKSGRLSTPARLTLDEWFNWPTGWTRNSQSVLFYSDRSGDLDIFQHRVGARDAQAIVMGRDEKRDPQVSADGRWILYLAWPRDGERIRAGEASLMRVPAEGGQPEVVLRAAGYPGPVRVGPDGTAPVMTAAGHPRFRCPSVPESTCVLSEQIGNEAVFTAFDPIEGRKGELARLNAEPRRAAFWDLSPDGRWIAFGARHTTNGRIMLLPLAGQMPREISAGDWKRLESVAWAADGQALFVTSYSSNGFPLLRVSLAGTAELLYTGSYYIESPVPSPDGRYLAFGEITPEGNVWVIDDLR
jgi:Tol biopolymer transport system component